MKYVIGTIALCLSAILTSAALFCLYKAWVDDPYWGFVMLGLMLPTALALLITQAAFSAAREY